MLRYATIIAPLFVTQIFWFFTAPQNPFYLPGAPFLFSAVLTIGCIAIFVSARQRLQVSLGDAKPVTVVGEAEKN